MKKICIVYLVSVLCLLCACANAPPVDGKVELPPVQEAEVAGPIVMSAVETSIKEEVPELPPVQEPETNSQPVIQESEPVEENQQVEMSEENDIDKQGELGCENFMPYQTYEQVQAYINETNNPDIISIVSVPEDYEYKYGECFYRRQIDNIGTQWFMYKCYYTIKNTDQEAMVEISYCGERPTVYFENAIDACKGTKKRYLRRFGDEDLYQYKLITDNMLYRHKDRPLWEEGGEINTIDVCLDGYSVYIRDPRITEENAVEFFQQFKFEKVK